MTEPEPSVLVFDVNETLLDIESLQPHFERIFGDPRVLREWFGQLVMYSIALTLSGRYTDFATLGRAVLQMTAEVHRVDPHRMFKPSPQLYTAVADAVGVPASACMMVAAHPWDLIGAQAVGMSAALLTRPGNAALPLPAIPAPTVVADDVADLARRLSGARP